MEHDHPLRDVQRRMSRELARIVAAEVPPRTEARRGRTFMMVYATLLGAALGAFVALACLVRGTALMHIDIAVARAVQNVHQPIAIWMVTHTSDLGWFPLNVVSYAVIFGTLFALRLRLEAVLAVVSSLAAGGVGQIVKNIVGRMRPSPWLLHVAAPLGGYSFPSGHVIQYVTLFGFTFYIVWVAWQANLVRNLILFLLAAPIVLVGLSRVYLGQHWPSDILGAYLFAGVWLAGTIELYRKVTSPVSGWRSRAVKRSEPHVVPLVCALALLAATLVLTVLVVAHPGPLPGDVGVMLWWQHLVLSHHTLTVLLDEVSTLNFPYTSTITIAIIIGVFGLFVRRLDMLLALGTLAVADGSNFLLNLLVHRPRPGGYGIVVDQHITTDYSFPSGHVEHAMAFLGIVIFLSFQVRQPPRWLVVPLWVARLYLFVLIVLMAPSRVLEGEHWPSDVLEGLLFGGFWLLVAMQVYRWAAAYRPELLGMYEPRPKPLHVILPSQGVRQPALAVGGSQRSPGEHSDSSVAKPRPASPSTSVRAVDQHRPRPVVQSRRTQPASAPRRRTGPRVRRARGG
jgi:undecaprenyl-diphosphatase